MDRSTDSKENVAKLLHKLCQQYAGNNPDVMERFLKMSLKFISSAKICHSSNADELVTVEKIRKSLSSEDDSKEKIKSFECLYNKLKKGTILHNRCAILMFLLNLRVQKIDDTRPILYLKETKTKPSILKSTSKSNYTITNQSSQNEYKDSFKTYETNSQVWPASILSEPPVRSVEILKSYSNTISESVLIKELIFSFQGIEGKVLRKEPGTGGFIIDSRINITRSQKAIVQRLAELGYLHNQIRQHCDSDKHIGVIGQSLVAALRDELTSYYEHISNMQSQLQPTSLRQLIVWVAEPQFRLQWLTNLALECEDKKGGALISTVYSFLQHGGSLAQTVIRRILKDLCIPLMRMLSRWLIDGYLEDPCGEFFIEARPVHKNERLWHDKYHVRSNMLPVFISDEQARKILIAGKSINFIREVCQDLSDLPGRNGLQRTFDNIDPEAMFTTELSEEVHKVIDAAYHETSDRVLDIMRGQNRLIEHMQAFRRYLLLGQGDFIRYLLELLAPELSKPANQILPHHLSTILDTAVRVTNAQFENPDTLQRLDVRLMEVSQGDIGWDVFTVLYHIDGPIGTVFEPTLDAYRLLFGALWKAKRMEFILSNTWKRQITSARLFRNIKDVGPVMQNIHIVTSEMVHFIHQTQYYFLFEVLECSWAEMLNKVNAAESLDDVIKAHNNFLQSVQHGVLVDSSSQALYTHLCTIYNTILKLVSIEELLYTRTMSEIDALKEFEKRTDMYALQDGFSVTKRDERQYLERFERFQAYLQSVKAQIRSVAKQYNDYVRKYLQMLAAHPDINLQLLSVRLDFNSFYERVQNREQQINNHRKTNSQTTAK